MTWRLFRRIGASCGKNKKQAAIFDNHRNLNALRHFKAISYSLPDNIEFKYKNKPEQKGAKQV